MSIMLAFSYHILGHVIQMILLKKYVPGVLTGLFSSFLVIYFGGHSTSFNGDVSNNNRKFRIDVSSYRYVK